MLLRLRKPSKKKPSRRRPAARARGKAEAGAKPLKKLGTRQRETLRQEQRLAEFTEEERRAARRIRVYVVLEDTGDEPTFVSAHRVQSVAQEAASQTTSLYVQYNDLEDTVRFARLTAEEARAWMMEEGRGLTQEEADEAAATKLWAVWYEDQFQAGPDRESAVPTAWYLEKRDANRDGDVKQRPLKPGWDGYSVRESTLYSHFRSDHLSPAAVRELLARKRGK